MGIQRLATVQNQRNTEQFQSMSAAIEKQLQTTLKEIKELALDIRPSVLDNFGLIPAIKALAKRLQNSTGITINVIALTSAENLQKIFKTFFTELHKRQLITQLSMLIQQK